MKNTTSSLRRVRLPRTPADWLEAVMNFIFFLCGMLAVCCVVLISVYMVVSGVPAIHKIGLFKFLFGTKWASTAAEPLFGILPFILTSIYGTAGAILLGVPVGFMTAVFLAKMAPPKLKTAVSAAVSLLAGIPSIIFGLVGMLLFVQRLGLKAGILAGGLTVVVMILPTIITVSKTSLDAVPQSYYEGSLALGATHERSVFCAVLPAAKSGVMSAVILGVGRAIGETMAVVMVAGNQTWMPKGLFQGLRTMTSNIVIEMGYAADLHREALIATGVVLFVFILLINLCFSLVKGGEKNG